jgi:hypothetical protein
MDEGLPIAYPVLERGVPVYCAEGSQVGSVDHVVAALEEDIFHGIVLRTGAGDCRFVAADSISSLHERGVDLRIGAADVEALEAPSGGAPAYREVEPGIKPSSWRRFLDLIEGRDPNSRSWRKQD